MRVYWNEHIECMPKEQLKKLQGQRLQDTVYRVYQNVPFYRKKMQEAGLAPENIKSRKTLSLGRKDVNQADDGVFAHFRNFILSVQGKEQPIAPPPIGQQAAISGHMATLAFKNQKKAIWDEAAQKVRFA